MCVCVCVCVCMCVCVCVREREREREKEREREREREREMLMCVRVCNLILNVHFLGRKKSVTGGQELWVLCQPPSLPFLFITPPLPTPPLLSPSPSLPKLCLPPPLSPSQHFCRPKSMEYITITNHPKDKFVHSFSIISFFMINITLFQQIQSHVNCYGFCTFPFCLSSPY